MKDQSTLPPKAAEDHNVLADAARLGGGSEKAVESAKALGEIAAADGRVERSFAEKGRGDAQSPVFQLVWGKRAEAAKMLLLSPDLSISEEAQDALNRIVATAKRLIDEGQIYGKDQKITEAAIRELAKEGFLRLLIPTEYGGLGLSVPAALNAQKDLASLLSILALFVSVHGLIGAVNPLRLFGNKAQKEKWFPLLGEVSSCFALTEPGAGSDVKNIKTTATLNESGTHFLVNGDKLFITNLTYGRVVSLVCMVEGPDGKQTPRVLILRTPEHDTDEFVVNRYQLHALKRTHNVGATFRNFPVPVEDLLEAPGLEIAFSGLNAARVAVDVNSEVAIMEMLAALLPWTRKRVTMKRAIGERALVDVRLAEALGLGYACDAIWRFGSAVLQQGFRGEPECIFAKVFGSEAAWQVVSEIYARTMGGRLLMGGDVGGDSLHDIRAEAIYEGENSMLRMKAIDSLLKGQVDRFLKPMLQKLGARGIKKLNMRNPWHLWWLSVYGAPQGWDFVKRLARYAVGSVTDQSTVGEVLRMDGVDGEHLHYAVWAVRRLEGLGLRLMAAMFKYQTAMPERQNQLVDFALRAEKLLVIALTAVAGAHASSKEQREAALLTCEELQRQLAAPPKSDRYYARAARLGRGLYENGCEFTSAIEHQEVTWRADYHEDDNALVASSVSPPV